MAQCDGMRLEGSFGGENKSSPEATMRGIEEIHQPSGSVAPGMWEEKGHHLRGLLKKQWPQESADARQ